MEFYIGVLIGVLLSIIAFFSNKKIETIEKKPNFMVNPIPMRAEDNWSGYTSSTPYTPSQGQIIKKGDQIDEILKDDK